MGVGLVVSWLLVKSEEVWDGNNSSWDTLLSKQLGSVNGQRNLGTGSNQNQLGVVNLVNDVTTLQGLLNRRARQLRQVLSRKSQHRWCLGARDGLDVSSRGLVTVCWSPDHQIWNGSEVGKGLNRLVGWSVLTKTNRVVGGNPDDWVVRESRQSQRTRGVGHKVEESGTERLVVGTVSRDTVDDGAHTVLSHTESEVLTGVVTQTSGLRLEVNGTRPSGQVGWGQIGRTTNQFRKNSLQLTQANLRKLSRSNSSVAWLVPVTNRGSDSDTRRLVGLLGLGNCLGDGGNVGVSVRNLEDVPSVLLESSANVLGESNLSTSVDGDLVVIVESNQVAQLQVASKRHGLGGDTFHHTSVTKETVGVVVGESVAWLVVGGSKVSLSNGQTNGIGDTLTKRTGCDLDTWDAHLRVARGLGVDLSERLEVVHGEVVAEQVQQCVQERTCVTVRKDKSISVDPVWVLWVEFHLGVDGVGGWSHSHWGTRVPGVGLGDDVGSQDSDCINGFCLDILGHFRKENKSIRCYEKTPTVDSKIYNGMLGSAKSDFARRTWRTASARFLAWMYVGCAGDSDSRSTKQPIGGRREV
ncbi:hypothetical protein OGATHE_004376 [Ogataea polymorpha]|uniref:Uncharacterized protein n=1 Tax=Ogataea polymorpha TaxID=460523 RepID=A0A9P8P0E9_9ASCO|nr:hypothetical protein OGATHE_004376 [Ogataea polymorpha]